MAENAAGAGTETAKVVAKAGVPVASPFPFPQQVNNEGAGNDDTANKDKGGEQQNGAAAASTAKAGENSNENKDDKNKGGQGNGSTGNQPAGSKDQILDPSEDQMKLWFEKNGIPFENLETLKAKVTASASAKELSPEEKEKIATEKRKRIVDEHRSRKGTEEQFVTFEKILTIEKKALGLDKEINELMSEGLSKEKAEQMAKRRYSQYTDEEIAAIEDKDEKAEMIKEREIGLKKLERKGGYLQKTAKDYLDILEKDIAEQDADTQKMEQHSSKVEDAVKKYERKMKLEIGQADDQKIDPIDFEVSDTALASAKELIGDRSKFLKQLLTEDGHVNLEVLLPHLVKSFSMDEAVKKSYLEAQDRTVKQLKAKFGTNLPTLGQPQNGNTGKGKIATAGKPTVGRPEFK